MRLKILISTLLLGLFSFNYAQTTDFTDQIINPSFETGNGNGWTWAYGATWLGPNTDGDATKDGNYINGIWNGAFDNNQCTQTISGLPAGNYTVTCLMTVSNNRLTNQRLFASSGATTQSVLFEAESSYSGANLAVLGASENYTFAGWTTSAAENGPFQLMSIDIDVATGQDLTIGVRTSGTVNSQGYIFPGVNSDAGFFKFDAFTLTGNFIPTTSSDATLSSITTLIGTLVPDFSPTILSYSVLVPDGTPSVDVDAITTDVNAQITSGTGKIMLVNGVGSTNILVTAENGSTTKTYTVTFKEECYSPTYPSKTNLVVDPLLNDGTAFGGWGNHGVTTDKSYCGIYSGYAGDNCSGSLDVVLTGKITANTSYRIKAQTYVSTGTFHLGFWGLDIATNEFNTSLTGQWETMDFVITTGPNANPSDAGMYFNACGLSGTGAFIDNWEIYEVDNDATLSALSSNVGSLSPNFSSNQTSYELVVPEGTTEVILTASANSTNSEVSGDGLVTLTDSAGLANIVVTAESGTIITYTVKIINGGLPVITLLGDANITIELGTNYVDAGATATDSLDGDLTSSIVVGGDTVDINTAGVYVITYNVTDSNGNAAQQVTRTVNVVPEATAQTPLQKNLFPLTKIELLDGPFKASMDLNIQTLLNYDVDRLLEPFLTEAGLTPNGERFLNWEPLAGHVGGHYLSALAMHYAATNNPQIKSRMDYMVSELKRCHDANGNGYVGGVPNSNAVWNSVKNKDFSSFWSAWVPWYNIHKTYAGLRDAWLYSGNLDARLMFLDLCDWGIDIISGLTTGEMQSMLNSEFGGMNEVYADAYEMTGDAKYLDAAKKFTHNYFFDSFVNNIDNLDNQHANTQIPKFVGFASVAQYDDTATNYETAADNFWNAVVDNRTVAFGGNSRREFFPAAASYIDFMIDRDGPESCNTYNMLKLASQLHMQNPNVKYADYYETALFNHILSTQHPDHGGYVYFTPMRTNHYRVYSAPDQAMWCCVGTGMENHGLHGKFIYSHDQDKLYVNLFVASKLKWEEKGVTITQSTNFPSDTETTLTIDGSATIEFMLRYPTWVTEGELELFINGTPTAVTAVPGEYISLNRTWNTGDEIRINMPMHLSYERLANVTDDYLAFKYGPILLGAKTDSPDLTGLVADDGRWSHIASGKLYGNFESPFVVSKMDTILTSFQKVEGEFMKFKASNLFPLEKYKDLTFEPFNQIHDSRYMMYWLTLDPDNADQIIAEIQAAEEEQLLLDERTVDYVSTGEQQPEVDHRIQEESSSTGIHENEYWRDASNGGYFSYELATEGLTNLTLWVKYWGNEGGNRTFDILVDDVVIATENIVGKWNVDEFVNVEYAIDPSLLAGKSFITVKFQAIPDNLAGGVFYIRLLKEASLNVQKKNKATKIIYPNPTSDIINIKGVSEGLIQVYSSIGTLLVQKNAKDTQSINLSEYPAGIYFMKIKEGNDVATFKVILK
ncbi:beta-L-arabinofuranosidase domain-containing protein [Flavobacteriaceae bacterium SZ-1-7]|uniref:beta-L-arabinofuranosidase domain-containing protein n=1 Tax=Tamlana sedimenti TaxID=3134126 RepID=UPI003120A7BB